MNMQLVHTTKWQAQYLTTGEGKSFEP